MKRQAYCLKQNQHLTQRWGWQDLVTSWVEVGRTSAPPGEDLNQASRAAERVEFRYFLNVYNKPSFNNFLKSKTKSMQPY